MPEYFVKLDKDFITIDCWLEGPLGEMPVSMLLDTASSLTCLPLNILSKIGVDLSRPVETGKIITVTGPVDVGIYRVPILRLFDFTLGEVPVAGLEASPDQSANTRLLGLNVLRMFNIGLNFENNFIKLELRKR